LECTPKVRQGNKGLFACRFAHEAIGGRPEPHFGRTISLFMNENNGATNHLQLVAMGVARAAPIRD
jgi:hypothetical protein